MLDLNTAVSRARRALSQETAGSVGQDSFTEACVQRRAFAHATFERREGQLRRRTRPASKGWRRARLLSVAAANAGQGVHAAQVIHLPPTSKIRSIPRCSPGSSTRSTSDGHDEDHDHHHGPEQRGGNRWPDRHVHVPAGNVQRAAAIRRRNQARGVRRQVHRPLFRRRPALLRPGGHGPHLQRRQRRGEQPSTSTAAPRSSFSPGQPQRPSQRPTTPSPARPRGSRSSSRATSSRRRTPEFLDVSTPPGTAANDPGDPGSRAAVAPHVHARHRGSGFYTSDAYATTPRSPRLTRAAWPSHSSGGGRGRRL